MIQEDYVSFEVAKLLKEKGFPQEYDDYHALVYNEEDYEDEYEVQRMVLETSTVKAGTLSSYPIGVPEPKCYCPTLQMAMKWLREVHGIHVIVIPYTDKEGNNWSFTFNKYSYDCWQELGIYITDSWNTYEEAVEAALKYTLENLI